MLVSFTVRCKTGLTHGEVVAEKVNELNATAARHASIEGAKTFTLVAVIPIPGTAGLMDMLVKVEEAQ